MTRKATGFESRCQTSDRAQKFRNIEQISQRRPDVQAQNNAKLQRSRVNLTQNLAFFKALVEAVCPQICAMSAWEGGGAHSSVVGHRYPPHRCSEACSLHATVEGLGQTCKPLPDAVAVAGVCEMLWAETRVRFNPPHPVHIGTANTHD